jgi:hypothetical protein
MRKLRVRAALLAMVGVWLLGSYPRALYADAAADFAGADAAALREMLEGTAGRREAWETAPDLVVLTSVLDYDNGGIASGYTAVRHKLDPGEIQPLITELTAAIQELTGGRFRSFRSITVQTVPWTARAHGQHWLRRTAYPQRHHYRRRDDARRRL